LSELLGQMDDARNYRALAEQLGQKIPCTLEKMIYKEETTPDRVTAVQKSRDDDGIPY